MQEGSCKIGFLLFTVKKLVSKLEKYLQKFATPVKLEKNIVKDY